MIETSYCPTCRTTQQMSIEVIDTVVDKTNVYRCRVCANIARTSVTRKRLVIQHTKEKQNA